MRQPRRFVSVAAAVIAVTMTSACGNGMTDEPNDTHGTTASGSPSAAGSPAETQPSVQDNARGFAREALQIWGSGASLRPMDPTAPWLWCSHFSDPPEGTPVHLNGTFELVGLGPDQRESALDDFVDYWQDKGWKLSYRQGDSAAVTHEDYVLSLTVSTKVGLGFDTPCVPGESATVPLEPITP